MQTEGYNDCLHCKHTGQGRTRLLPTALIITHCGRAFDLMCIPKPHGGSNLVQDKYYSEALTTGCLRMAVGTGLAWNSYWFIESSWLLFCCAGTRRSVSSLIVMGCVGSFLGILRTPIFGLLNIFLFTGCALNWCLNENKSQCWLLQLHCVKSVKWRSLWLQHHKVYRGWYHASISKFGQYCSPYFACVFRKRHI